MSRTARERYAHLRQSFWRHPVVRTLSKGARWLYCAALSYAMDASTDGRIAAPVLTLLDGTKREAAELVASGLWLADDEGFVIKSYLEHNAGTEAMDAKRRVRQEAGSRGGKAKAARVANATATGKQSGSIALPDKDKEEDKEIPTGSPPLPPQGAESGLPETFEARRGHLLRAHRDRYQAATGNPVPAAKNAPGEVDRVTSWLAGYAQRTGQSYPDAVEAVLTRWWQDPYATSKGWPMWHLAKHVDEFAESLPPVLDVPKGGMLRPGTHAEHAADAAEGGEPW